MNDFLSKNDRAILETELALLSGVTGTSAKWMKPEEGLCYSLTCEASSLHDWSVPDHMNHMFFSVCFTGRNWHWWNIFWTNILT